MVLPYTVVAQVIHQCKVVVLIFHPCMVVFLIVHPCTLIEQMDLLHTEIDLMVPPCIVVSPMGLLYTMFEGVVVLDHGVYGLIGKSSLLRNACWIGLTPKRIRKSWMWLSRIQSSGSMDRGACRRNLPPRFFMLQPHRFPPSKKISSS